MKRLLSTLLLLSLLPLAANATEPSDFAVTLPLEAPPDAALLRLELNEAVYRVLRRADLGDLRIFNRAGEALPMARLPRSEEPREIRVRVALAALPPSAPGSGEDTQVSVRHRGGDTQVEVELREKPPHQAPGTRFLIDTGRFDRQVEGIAMVLEADQAFEGRLRIDTSSDLARWKTLAEHEVVLAVGVGDSRLERSVIPLAGTSQRYLRLSWLDAPPDPPPRAVELIHHQRAAAPSRHWLTLPGTASGGHVDYRLPGLFPVDRARLRPDAGNDVVAALIASRPTVTTRWHEQARTVGYSLQTGGATREGAAVTLPPTRDALWRVTLQQPDTNARAPLLELGWLPEEVVFVARGEGPFRLAAGQPDISPAWLRAEQLVPGFGTPQAAPIAVARIAEDQTRPAPIVRPPSPWQPGRHWWLWGALVLGVVLLAWMARGLWRDLKRPPH